MLLLLGQVLLNSSQSRGWQNFERMVGIVVRVIVLRMVVMVVSLSRRGGGGVAGGVVSKVS